MTVDDRQDEDDLGRAFGPDTSSVTARPMSQRVRTWSLVGGGVVLVTAIVAGSLYFLVNGVQTGIGGVFPRPEAALSAFRSDAAGMDGVSSTAATDPTHTTFASYDVTATVTADAALDADAQDALVDELSDAARAASGNGVHVYALVRMGDAEVGVSPKAGMTEDRLSLARQLEAIGGVDTVTVGWSGDGEGGAARDTEDGQRIVVRTPASGDILGAIRVVAGQKTAAVFPDAEVVVEAPPAG